MDGDYPTAILIGGCNNVSLLQDLTSIASIVEAKEDACTSQYIFTFDNM